MIGAFLQRWRARFRPTPFERLRRAAECGEADAQYSLGQAYLQGGTAELREVANAPRSAVNWLELAARQGHVEAQHSLSLVYLHGARAGGGAATWFDEARRIEAARANAELLYPDGLAIEAMPERAFALAMEAAVRGHAAAQANLGMLFLRAVGCGQDFAAAESWFRRAADQNDPGGALGLGLIFEHGFGRAPDTTEAARWYAIAAEVGNDAAATALGILHLNGAINDGGMARDLAKAERLLRGPAARGNPFAQKALQSLRSASPTTAA
jgi:TPR repeat protein